MNHLATLPGGGGVEGTPVTHGCGDHRDGNAMSPGIKRPLDKPRLI